MDAIVQGMRARWTKGRCAGGAESASVQGLTAGECDKREAVYARRARAATERPGRSRDAGSILDGSFLALINAQTVRTTVIAGRPDIGQPDWRGHMPGHPLTDDDVSDVSAWLMAQRPATPGQPYPDNNTTTQNPGEAQPHGCTKSKQMMSET